MIQFNTNLEDLKAFVLEHGKLNTWNYSENLLVKDILISENTRGKYKIVMIRYYKASGQYIYTNSQTGEESSCDYIKEWCPITI